MADSALDLGGQFSALLQQEHTLLRELIKVMGTERDLLLNDGDLDSVLQQKQALLDQVETATQARFEWLRVAGVEMNHLAIREYIATLEPTGKLAKEFFAFEAAAAECKQCNISLSQIICRRQQFVSRAAASMGVGPDVSQASYSEDGQSVAETAPRHLGSA